MGHSAFSGSPAISESPASERGADWLGARGEPRGPGSDRAWLESIPAIAWRTDENAVIVERNRQWFEYTGQRPEAASGMDWVEVLHPDDRLRVAEAVARAVAGGGLLEAEFRVRRADGVYRWCLGRASPVRDAHGDVTGWIGIGMDIEDRKRAEDALRVADERKNEFLRALRASEHRYRRLSRELEGRVVERTAQLEAANKELESFAYSVSHDLRAPLRHVLGFLDLFRARAARSVGEEDLHLLTNIEEAASRMTALIDDLLSFSRVGRCEMTPRRVDLGALAREVIAELEPDARGRTVGWRVAELPAVSGDRAMLRIALANLLDNALKFTRPRPRAEIELGWRRGEGETVVFVRDNGVGFDMRFADGLFGVFRRLHGSDAFEGTGIGLANVQRMIRRHGGRCWAEGAVDAGATFYFSLPDRVADDATREADRASPGAHPAGR